MKVWVKWDRIFWKKRRAFSALLADLPKLFSGDSVHGTCSFASAAVYALISVDFVLAITFGDRGYGTFISAGTACYTFIRNNSCHN